MIPPSSPLPSLREEPGRQEDNKSESRSDYSGESEYEDSSEVAELKLTIEGMDEEIWFYFGKLIAIERMVQERDDNETEPFLQRIQNILYAKPDP